MPSRKQRRRREKSFRHEYETILLDEEGNEVVVDPEQARKEREEREQRRADAKPAPRGKGGGAAKSGRPMREPPVPTWNRALKRGGLMGAVIFLAFVFVLKGGSTVSRAAIAAVYALAFVPLTYFVDRVAYRTYQRRLERSGDKKS
jgi:hypothetical protein